MREYYIKREYLWTNIIKLRQDAVHILRELKKHNIGYCITEYDECIVYFTVTNILKREISILENIEWIEEINE